MEAAPSAMRTLHKSQANTLSPQLSLAPTVTRGSSSESYFDVMNAPSATPTPTPTPVSMADLYFMPLSIGMFIAIVIVGALLALLMLRKRP